MKTTNNLTLPTLNAITTELRVKNYVPKSIDGDVITTYKIKKSGIDYTTPIKYRYIGEMTAERTITLPQSSLEADTSLLTHYKGVLNIIYPKSFNALKTSEKTIKGGTTYTFNSSEFKKGFEVWLKATGKYKGFQETEYLGRSLFVQLKPELDIFFTEDKYAPYDAEFINSNGGLTLVEIKTRDINHDDYRDALFETGKLQKMKHQKAYRDAEKMIYINFYKDSKAVVWVLENYDGVTPITMKSKYQTHGNSMKVDKSFIPLPITEGYIETLNFKSSHFNNN